MNVSSSNTVMNDIPSNTDISNHKNLRFQNCRYIHFILLGLILASIFFIYFFFLDSQHLLSDRFIVIYEAGSSHTSAFIFTWKEPFSDFKEFVPSKSVEPGLSSFISSTQEIENYLLYVIFSLFLFKGYHSYHLQAIAQIYI